MTKILNPKQFKYIIITSIIGFVLLPAIAFAAKLYLEPSQGEYYKDETFIVEVRIDTEGEDINTVEVNLEFPTEFLEAKDFSAGNSILTLLVAGPDIDQESGIISFSGAIPGGYSGRLPGDPGESNLLGKIIFKVRKTDLELIRETGTKLEFKDSEVLLNDGLGTPAKLTTRGSVFTILAGEKEISKDQWQEEIKKDGVPPEPFKIEISQDPSIFEGKYFIIFSTTDKQTGIGHYEVKEGEKDWEVKVSPYLLEDQNFKGIMKVKAVDKAGNERIELLEIPGKIGFRNLYWVMLILVGMGVFGLIAIKKYKK